MFSILYSVSCGKYYINKTIFYVSIYISGCLQVVSTTDVETCHNFNEQAICLQNAFPPPRSNRNNGNRFSCSCCKNDKWKPILRSYFVVNVTRQNSLNRHLISRENVHLLTLSPFFSMFN